jgi:hypothetical protein
MSNSSRVRIGGKIVKAFRMRLSRARELTARQWSVLLSALFWLAVTEAGLRLFGLSRLQRMLLPPRRRGHGKVSPEEIGEIVRLVDMAVRRLPYSGTCLRRSLVLQRFLAREGIETELRFGVRKSDRGLEAHAWLEHEGRPLGEAAPVEERFAKLLLAGELRKAFP